MASTLLAIVVQSLPRGKFKKSTQCASTKAKPAHGQPIQGRLRINPYTLPYKTTGYKQPTAPHNKYAQQPTHQKQTKIS